MEKQLLDNGPNTVTANEESSDNRHIANGKAAAIVAAILKSEAALSVTASEWGAALFRSVKNDNVSLDTLIGESKLAAGFATLGTTEPGRKAKQRLNVYFSNARLVAERFDNLSSEAQAKVLDGTSSIHYLAGQFRDSDRKAAAEKKAAEAAAEAAANPDAVTGDNANKPQSLLEMVDALMERWAASTDDEKADAYDAVAAFTALVNDDIAADAESIEGEAEKLAA